MAERRSTSIPGLNVDLELFGRTAGSGLHTNCHVCSNVPMWSMVDNVPTLTPAAIKRGGFYICPAPKGKCKGKNDGRRIFCGMCVRKWSSRELETFFANDKQLPADSCFHCASDHSNCA